MSKDSQKIGSEKSSQEIVAGGSMMMPERENPRSYY